MAAHLPSLRQLRYLLALKRHGHFGRAAAASHVSQSTLSAGLAELEALLGQALVERSRRGLRFTAAGEAVAERAGRLLRDADDLVAAAQAAGRPLTGELRLAVIPTVAPFLLPRLLARAGADWPDLRLKVRETASPSACAALDQGEVDCALLALPFDCGDVETAEVAADALLLAMPAAEAARWPATVAPRDVDADALLLLEDGHCLKDHALAACGQAGAAADGRMVGASLHTLVRMVDSGLGSTVLPRLAVDAGILAGTGVETRAIGAPAAERRIALAWRRGSPRAADYRRLAGTVAALFG